MSHHDIMSQYDIKNYYTEISKNSYDIEDIKNLLTKVKSTISTNQPILLHPTLLGLGRFAGVGKNSKKVASAWYKILSHELKDYPWALPAFSYGFLRTRSFNKLTSPCDLCILSKKALDSHPENRTNDPVFSFTLMGNMDFWHENGYFDLNIKNNQLNPFGEDSFFDKFTKNNGNIMILSYMELYSDFLTYVHYLEAKSQVKYRYYKNFAGTIDDNQQITYKYLVKPMELGIKYSERIITDYDHGIFVLGSQEHKFNKIIITNTTELLHNIKYLDNNDLTILSKKTQKDITSLQAKVGYPFTLNNCG